MTPSPEREAVERLEITIGKCKIASRKAWIINIGTEVVMGTVVNTNGAWLARKLTFLGFEVEKLIAVPDKEDSVVEELDRSLARGLGLVITTGGLGPTYDDSTSSFVAKALGVEETLDELAYSLLLEKYGGDESRVTPERRKQAIIPRGFAPIPNPVGTAPGFASCIEGTVFSSLPGVPREMQAMFEKYLEPLLREKTGISVGEATLVMIGPREADLAPLLKRLVKRYPDAYIKTHPSIDEKGRSVIRFQVVARGTNPDDARKKASLVVDELVKLMEEEKIRWTPG